MQRLKIDFLKFTGAKRFTAKDGTEFVAIPLAANNIFAAEMAGLDFQQCLQAAYDEIAGRTGTMIGGQFVKDK
jgi:hypothetical protein